MNKKILSKYQELFLINEPNLLQNITKKEHNEFYKLFNGSTHLGEVRSIDFEDAQKEIIAAYGENLAKFDNVMFDLFNGQAKSLKKYFANAIPQPTILSTIANFYAGDTTANSVWDHYGKAAAEAEIRTTSMLNKLIDYGPDATGYFTLGGSAANRAGVRIGLEKAMSSISDEEKEKAYTNLHPFVKEHGSFTPSEKRYSRLEMGNVENVIIFSTDISHFSIDDAASSNGIGKIYNIQVLTNADNSMNLDDLDYKLNKAIESGLKIGTIVGTTGTTDGFGIDDIKGISEIRDKAYAKHNLNYKPHIHADAAMGGLYVMFNNYDFKNNPLEFNERSLENIFTINEKMANIKFADSYSIDFHKLGYNTYMSTFLGIKDIADASLVARGSGNSPYILKKALFGSYHLDFPEECSRGFGSVGAYINCKFLAGEGYQSILGHLIENSDHFKDRLRQTDNIEVLNDNPGPVVAFRTYHDSSSSAASKMAEIYGGASVEEMQRTNALNEQIATHFGVHRGEFFFGSTDRYRTNPDNNTPIKALKAFMISPLTSKDDLDQAATYISKVANKFI